MSVDKTDHDEQYSLEMFRRALAEQDALAWEYIQEHFNGMVRRWLRYHAQWDIACRFDSEENYVALSFERFWYATACKQNIQFPTLAAALDYLRMSVSSTVVDTLRTYKRDEIVPLPGEDDPYEPWVDDYDDHSDVWEVIERMLPDKRERRIAYLLYYCGLKPKQIITFCPQEFSDVREIYIVRCRIVERFVRKAESLRWQLQC